MSACFHAGNNEATLYPGRGEACPRNIQTGEPAQSTFSRSPDASPTPCDVKRENHDNQVRGNTECTACLHPELHPGTLGPDRSHAADVRIVASSVQPQKTEDMTSPSATESTSTSSTTTTTSSSTCSSSTTSATSAENLRVNLPPSSSSSSATVSPSDDVMASKVPARALNIRTRTRLSLMLNPAKVLHNDWMELAGEMGFEYEEIQNFEREKDPTKAVLLAWSCRQGSTIGALLTMLQDINRQDVLEEVMKLAERDASRWMERRNGDINGQPVQDPEVSGSYMYPYVPETPELRGITLDDHVSGPPEVFDAYVCFTYADSEFVKEMMSVLENDPYNLKLCIDFRDLVPGGSYSTITAEIIENRCKRMIIILSPDFLVSEDCNFQTKFAHSIAPSARSKRLIPVMVESCQPPNILRHLTICDYTKTDLREWFWPRLYSALTKK